MRDNLLKLEIESLQRELEICLRDLEVLSGVEVTLTPKGGLRYGGIGTEELIVNTRATLIRGN